MMSAVFSSRSLIRRPVKCAEQVFMVRVPKKSSISSNLQLTMILPQQHRKLIFITILRGPNHSTICLMYNFKESKLQKTIQVYCNFFYFARLINKYEICCLTERERGQI